MECQPSYERCACPRVPPRRPTPTFGAPDYSDTLPPQCSRARHPDTRASPSRALPQLLQRVCPPVRVPQRRPQTFAPRSGVAPPLSRCRLPPGPWLLERSHTVGCCRIQETAPPLRESTPTSNAPTTALWMGSLRTVTPRAVCHTMSVALATERQGSAHGADRRATGAGRWCWVAQLANKQRPRQTQARDHKERQQQLEARGAHAGGR